MRLRKLLLLSLCFSILLACSNSLETGDKINLSNKTGEELSDYDRHTLPEQDQDSDILEDSLNHTQESPVLHEEDETTGVRIMAIGDIMMHMPQVNSARTDSGYDFKPVFEEVAPIFAKADLVLGNLETTLAGAERGFSGYPQFNSPDELTDALASAGFDVISTANNHSLDKGELGLVRTLDQLDRVGLQHTGTFRSNEEQNDLLIIEKNRIKLAVLAYTYGTNGIPIPSGKEYLVNLINHQQMEEDLHRAKQVADLVIVSIHFGTEYQQQPNQEQIDLVNQLFYWGADLILGSHPHVLQPLEHRNWLTEEGIEREGVVIYSLGNFISNQREQPRDIGGILSVTVSKTGQEITFTQVEFRPTYVHIYTEANKNKYKIVPLSTDMEDFPFLSEHYQALLSSRYQSTMKHVFPKNDE